MGLLVKCQVLPLDLVQVKTITMKKFKYLPYWFLILFIVACTKQGTEDAQLDLNGETVGQFFLIAINDTEVAAVECYQDSFIGLTAESITFFIVDRNQDGSCTVLLDAIEPLSTEDGFYYIGDEALDLYVEGDVLTWRADLDTELVFRRR